MMTKLTEIKVEMTGVHLCCQGCVNAADAALMSVEGVNSHCNMENGTVTLTAIDDTTAQRALDAFAAAGFYGSVNNQNLAMKATRNVPRGKVKRLNVSGIHNCCGPCCDAIKDAIARVGGVTSDSAKPGVTTFEVTGNFNAVSLVKALNAVGFSAQVHQQ